MRDHWLTREIFSALGGLIDLALLLMALTWLLAAWAAWRRPKTLRRKGLWLLLVALGALLNVGLVQHLKQQALQPLRDRQAAQEARYAKAKALYDAHCQTAGDTIYKTVEEVEGIQLEGLREGGFTWSFASTQWEGAGMPYEAVGPDYIATFFQEEHLAEVLNLTRRDGEPYSHFQPVDVKHGIRGMLGSDKTPLVSRGYRYVDIRQADGQFTRHTPFVKEGDMSKERSLQTDIKAEQAARYLVKYQDNTSDEDRENWVAGAIVTISDTHTGELIAVRRAFAFEQAFGNTNSGRSPWRNVRQMCPKVRSQYRNSNVRFFADQIIQPIQEP